MPDHPAVHAQLSDNARIGGVRLQIADLERSLVFYRDLLGFTELSRQDGYAELAVPGAPRALVTLVERRDARPVRPRSRLGLFHFAVLVPDRASLGSVLVHLGDRGVPLGMSDHLVSEALYLSDPDGLGIEIYRDRPRAEWPREGPDLVMATDPLDARGLAAEPGAGVWQGMPAGTVIGHMHLHVDDLARAEAFYHGTIGFDVTVRRYPGALFMSAGGYHHHLGVNTWARGASAPAPDDAQLLDWELVVDDPGAVAAVAERVAAAGGETSRGGDGAVLARDLSGTVVRVVAD